MKNIILAIILLASFTLAHADMPSPKIGTVRGEAAEENFKNMVPQAHPIGGPVTEGEIDCGDNVKALTRTHHGVICSDRQALIDAGNTSITRYKCTDVEAPSTSRLGAIGKRIRGAFVKNSPCQN